jgi:DnaJ-class molecular chaperone
MSTKNFAICIECKGYKVTTKIKYEMCKSCDGRGVIDTGSCLGTCMSCLGFGKVPKATEIPCRSCFAKGIITY